MRILSSYFTVLASLLMFFVVASAFAQPTPAPTPTTHTVTIQNFQFTPERLEVAPGDTVVWTNQDSVPHTATSTDNRTFNSGVIPPGSSFTMVMPTAGEFPYMCTIHPFMMATLVVAEPGTLPSPPAPTPAPTPVPPATPTSPY